MRSCRRPVKCNTEPLGKSCGEELLSVQREKSERKLKKSKIHREKQKEKWAKQATEKKERNHDFFGSGVLAADRFMTTLITQSFAKCGGNSLSFHCCTVQNAM